MSKKVKTIKVQNREVTFFTQRKDDYISLTDIARYRDADRSDYILQNWLRNRSTIEFIGLWEQLNNPDFNSIEFDGFKKMETTNFKSIEFDAFKNKTVA